MLAVPQDTLAPLPPSPIPMSTMLEVVLPIVVTATDASWVPVGTAFVVGVIEPRTALLLTAAHNVERIRTLETGRDRSHPTTPSDFRPYFKHFEISRVEPFVNLVRAGQGIPVEIHDMWELGSLDVALLVA